MKKKKIIICIVSICILITFTFFIYHIFIHKDLVEEQNEQIEYGFKRLLTHGDDIQVNIDNVEIYLYENKGYVLFEYISHSEDYGDYDSYLVVFEDPNIHYFKSNADSDIIRPYKEMFDEVIENYDYNYQLTQEEIDDFIMMYQ